MKIKIIQFTTHKNKQEIISDFNGNLAEFGQLKLHEIRKNKDLSLLQYSEYEADLTIIFTNRYKVGRTIFKAEIIR